ncbi:unnamed protein product [Anisakis simplex]|uniref:Col_cuticle_N domain-containing protein n=1 Tax=Anisakis simplex TaxID=6269 RepID=A0A0M3JH01_ANISI|nr:unnamed protein product [Anisakis simplex]VDK27544.1 unnamed protein product [Anisakis simplex]
MYEAKLIVCIATLCTTCAMVACLVIIPSLYREIDQLHAEVFDSVQVFKAETDAAWTEIMQLQIFAVPPSKPRENPLHSLFVRSKRHDYSKLPSFCHCEPVKPVCPPGPPGPRGDPGPDGRKRIFIYMHAFC